MTWFRLHGRTLKYRSVSRVELAFPKLLSIKLKPLKIRLMSLKTTLKKRVDTLTCLKLANKGLITSQLLSKW